MVVPVIIADQADHHNLVADLKDHALKCIAHKADHNVQHGVVLMPVADMVIIVDQADHHNSAADHKDHVLTCIVQKAVHAQAGVVLKHVVMVIDLKCVAQRVIVAQKADHVLKLVADLNLLVQKLALNHDVMVIVRKCVAQKVIAALKGGPRPEAGRGPQPPRPEARPEPRREGDRPEMRRPEPRGKNPSKKSHVAKVQIVVAPKRWPETEAAQQQDRGASQTCSSRSTSRTTESTKH